MNNNNQNNIKSSHTLNTNDLEQITGGSTIHVGEGRPDEFGGEHFATGTKRGYIVSESGKIIGER